MINICLIEKQKIVREGIKVLLEKEPDFKVYISDSKDVQISLLERLNPDVILISLDNLDESDFSYIDIFLNLSSDIDSNLQKSKIIIYAEKVNELILSKALNKGCQGYLLKESSIEELKQAIRSVYKGYRHIGNSVFNQVKQLSAASTVAVTSDRIDLDNKRKYHTGLLTTSQDELELDNLATNSIRKADPPWKNNTDIDINSKSDTVSSFTLLPAKSESRWRKFAHTMLFIGLGCIGGIAGALTMGDRSSFKPLAKYGTIRTNPVAIKSSYSGKIEQLNYQVGDRVELNQAIAEIEPASVPQKQEKIAKINQQIANIQSQIDLKEQLLINDQLKIKQEQQKIRELFTAKLSGDRLENNNKTNTEAQITSNNDQNLQDLSQENIISNRELTRTKQVLSNTKNKANKNDSIPEKQVSKAELFNLAEARSKLEQLQNNVEQWQTKISARISSIDIANKQLEDLQKQLKDIQNSLLNSESTSIKAPFKGIIRQTYIQSEQIVDEDETIAQMLNCQNIWIEVNLSYENIRKINFQQPVLLHLEEYNQNLLGKISSIRPLAELSGESLNFPHYQDSSLQSYLNSNNADESMLFKVNIDFNNLANYTQYDDFCGVGNTRLITFNS